MQNTVFPFPSIRYAAVATISWARSSYPHTLCCCRNERWRWRIRVSLLCCASEAPLQHKRRPRNSNQICMSADGEGAVVSASKETKDRLEVWSEKCIFERNGDSLRVSCPPHATALLCAVLVTQGTGDKTLGGERSKSQSWVEIREEKEEEEEEEKEEEEHCDPSWLCLQFDVST